VPYASNQGLRIHYQVEGDGPPLVLQHGSASSIDAWYQNGCVASLQAHYQLILIDARGHGASDKPHDAASYALPLRVGDVVAVLDDLGIQRTHYWGYSMGGWIGFGMAKHAASRVQSLILGGAHPFAENAEVFHGVDGTDPDAFIAAMEEYVGVRVTLEIRDWILGNDLQALAAAMHDRDSLEEIVSTISMPCFLYAGADDPRRPKVESCAKDMPDAAFVSIPDFNHAQAYMRSDLVLPGVVNFLRAVGESK
jgi:pimeloyl-ACP methyl ester carboxylesterase